MSIGRARWFLFVPVYAIVHRVFLHFYWRSDCLRFLREYPEIGSCAYGDGKLDAQVSFMLPAALLLALLGAAVKPSTYAVILSAGLLAGITTPLLQLAAGPVFAKLPTRFLAVSASMFVAGAVTIGTCLGLSRLLSSGAPNKSLQRSRDR